MDSSKGCEVASAATGISGDQTPLLLLLDGRSVRVADHTSNKPAFRCVASRTWSVTISKADACFFLSEEKVLIRLPCRNHFAGHVLVYDGCSCSRRPVLSLGTATWSRQILPTTEYVHVQCPS